MTGKSKIIVWSLVGVLILAAIFLPLTFLVFLKKPLLNSPNAPTLIITETKIIATTNEVEGAKSYIFRFTTPNDDNIEITSSQSSVYVDMSDSSSADYVGDFGLAGIYQVKVYAVDEDSKSDYSQSTTFERYIKLTKPTISTYNSNSQLFVRWAKIESANLYEIYITSSTQETKVVQIFSSNSDFENFNVYSNMATLDLPSGDYQLAVVAKNSTNTYYTESLFSTPLSFNYEE